MKKSILAVTAVLFASAAQAQSSVTLYGSIDEGVTYATNEKGSGTALAGPVAVPDFIGFRGSEDLGNGLKAVFALQDAFLSNTGAGTIANDAFSHFAWVGLSSSRFGTFTMGRQLDLTTEALRLNSDGSLQYTFYLFHPANLDNVGILDDSINNSVRYTTPNIDGFTASAVYGFDDTTTQPGRVVSADVSYANGPFRASAVYSSWRNHAISVGSDLGYTSFLGESLAGGAAFTAQTQEIGGLSALYSIGKAVDLHGMLTQVNLGTATGAGRMRTAEAGVDLHTSATNTVNFGGYLSWLTDTRVCGAGCRRHVPAFGADDRLCADGLATRKRRRNGGDSAARAVVRRKPGDISHWCASLLLIYSVLSYVAKGRQTSGQFRRGRPGDVRFRRNASTGSHPGLPRLNWPSVLLAARTTTSGLASSLKKPS